MLGRNFFKWVTSSLGLIGSLDSMWPRRLIRSSDLAISRFLAFSAERDVPSVLAASGSNAPLICTIINSHTSSVNESSKKCPFGWSNRCNIVL